jgi:cytochrome c-type biogenesis protein CcmH/NrfG
MASLETLRVRWWQFVAARKSKHGRYADALETLAKVIRAQPNRALPFAQLGSCLFKLNRTEEARDAYERALQIVPDYADAHAFLALSTPILAATRKPLHPLIGRFESSLVC